MKNLLAVFLVLILAGCSSEIADTTQSQNLVGSAFSVSGQSDNFYLHLEQDDQVLEVRTLDHLTYSHGYMRYDGGDWQEFSLNSRPTPTWIYGEVYLDVLLDSWNGEEVEVALYSCSSTTEGFDCHNGWQVLSTIQASGPVEEDTSGDGQHNPPQRVQPTISNQEISYLPYFTHDLHFDQVDLVEGTYSTQVDDSIFTGEVFQRLSLGEGGGIHVVGSVQNDGIFPSASFEDGTKVSRTLIFNPPMPAHETEVAFDTESITIKPGPIWATPALDYLELMTEDETTLRSNGIDTTIDGTASQEYSLTWKAVTNGFDVHLQEVTLTKILDREYLAPQDQPILSELNFPFTTGSELHLEELQSDVIRHVVLRREGQQMYLSVNDTQNRSFTDVPIFNFDNPGLVGGENFLLVNQENLEEPQLMSEGDWAVLSIGMFGNAFVELTGYDPQSNHLDIRVEHLEESQTLNLATFFPSPSEIDVNSPSAEFQIEGYNYSVWAVGDQQNPTFLLDLDADGQYTDSHATSIWLHRFSTLGWGRLDDQVALSIGNYEAANNIRRGAHEIVTVILNADGTVEGLGGINIGDQFEDPSGIFIMTGKGMTGKVELDGSLNFRIPLVQARAKYKIE